MPTLEKDIEKFKEDFETATPKETLKVFANSLEKLKESKVVEKALKVGDKIPEFTLSNQNGKIVNIKTIIEKYKYTVISFFRGSWSPYCLMELNHLQKIFSQLKIYNGALISISPQTQDKSSYTHDKYMLGFDILYDKNNTIAKEFKICTKLDDELIPIYDKMKMDILEANRNGTYELPFPATYIVNKNYEIIHSFVDVDFTKRLEPKEILNIIKKDIINKK